MQHTGVEALAIDPSRGNILTIEVDRESWPERVEKYAGFVGYAIFCGIGCWTTNRNGRTFIHTIIFAWKNESTS